MPEGEKRKGQRRKHRVGRCRRCHGFRYVPTGEPAEPLPNGTGDVGTPIKRCSCTDPRPRWPH